MSKKNTLEKFGTDIERLRKMKDEDIDFSDIPRTTPEMWEKGFIRKGLKTVENKKQITLRIDQDVLDFFKNQGKGYHTKINQLLRTYMEEVQKQS